MADWFDQNAPDWFAKNAPSSLPVSTIRPASTGEKIRQNFRDLGTASHNPVSLWQEINKPIQPPGTTDIDQSVPYWLLGGATLGKSRLASTIGQAAKGVLRGQKLSKALQEAWQAVRSEANYIPKGEPAPGYSAKAPEGSIPSPPPKFGTAARGFKNPSGAPPGEELPAPIPEEPPPLEPAAPNAPLNFRSVPRTPKNPAGAPIGEPVPAVEYPPHPSGKPYPEAAIPQPSSAPGAPSLDEIAQGFGFKSFNVIKSQKDRSNVYSAWRAATQQPPAVTVSAVPKPLPAIQGEPASPAGAAPNIEGIPPPRPVHEAAHAIDTHFSPRKAMNLTRHLQEQRVPFEEVNAMVAKAKATGNWDAINALEKDAWTSGKALEASGAAKPGALVPKTPYRPKTADYSGIEGIENTEGTWDRVLKSYPRSIPKPKPPASEGIPAPQGIPVPTWGLQ